MDRKVQITVWAKGHGSVETSDYDLADEELDGRKVFGDLIDELDKRFGDFILNDISEYIGDFMFEYEEIERFEDGEWNGPDDCTIRTWYRVSGDVSANLKIIIDTDDTNDPRIKDVLRYFPDDKAPYVETIDW